MAFQNYTIPSVPGWHPAAPADIVEPLAGVKTTGHREQEYPPYEYVNWFWDNLSDWIDFSNEQMSVMESTTSNDAVSVTDTAAAQAYLTSLPANINSDITINLTGGGVGFTNGALTFSNFRGTGSLTIQNNVGTPMTDWLESITSSNVDLQGGLTFNDIRFEGALTTCLYLSNCKRTTVQNCAWDTSTWFIQSFYDSNVIVNGCINRGVNGAGTENLNVIRSRYNSFVSCVGFINITDEGTNRVTGNVFYAQDGGQICFDDNIIITESGQDWAYEHNGGKVWSSYDGNVLYTIDSANKADSVQSYIDAIRLMRDSDQARTIAFTLAGGPYTLPANVYVRWFGGGSALTFTGSGGTAVISSNTNIYFEENQNTITAQNLNFSNASADIIASNQSYLKLLSVFCGNDVTFQDGSKGYMSSCVVAGVIKAIDSRLYCNPGTNSFADLTSSNGASIIYSPIDVSGTDSASGGAWLNNNFTL